MLKNEIQYFYKIWSERLILVIRRPHNQILKNINKHVWTSILRQSENAAKMPWPNPGSSSLIIYLASLGQIAKQGYCFNVPKNRKLLQRIVTCSSWWFWVNTRLAGKMMLNKQLTTLSKCLKNFS